MKTVEDDPEFDVKKAQKKLRRYVESHDHAIRQKAEIMVDHFHEQVMARQKIGGQARAMVVTGGIERAIEYYHAFEAYLKERKSPYKAIVAFSGEHEYGGEEGHGSDAERIPQQQIAERFQEDPYRFLIVAESSRRATTSRCCIRCTSTRRCRASRRCRRSRGSTARIQRSTTRSCWTSERRGHDPEGV